MSLILTRSPFYVSRGSLDDNATLKLEIGDYNQGGTSVSKTYNLTFKNSYLLDISPLLSGFISESYIISNGNYAPLNTQKIGYTRLTLSGSLLGVAQSDVVSYYLFSDGYLYSTDDYNKDYSIDLDENCYYAGSTDVVYKLDDSNLRLSFISANKSLTPTFPASENLTIQYKKNKEVLKTTTKSIQYDYSGNLLFKVYSHDHTSFKERVLSDGGLIEDSNCYFNFLDSVALEDFDEVVLSTENGNSKSIIVKTISECNHNPYRATFKNRFGAYEDLWFFKRSDTSITINKESYRSNSLSSYNSGNGVKTFTDFNVNGREKITLNSGFVEEEMNEAFKQLLLSEEITLYDYKENKTYNVNLGTSELQYKTHVNDKLINYTIEFEFAHEVINNVG